MTRFLLQRVAGMLVTMFAVSIMVFIIMELPPGDYADRYAFRQYSGTGVNVTQADIQAIRVEYGLDRPAPERYLSWIGGILLRGDFGQAFAFETSVTKVLGERIWLTVALLFTTLMLTYLISIPIGIYAAVFSAEYKEADWSFAKAIDLLKHLIVPAIVLSWSATALQLQTVRSTMLDELNKLSVTAARARGLPEWKLLTKYPARLAINPVVSTIGFDVNRIFSELPIVALVLGLPELGELLIKSYLDLDMYVAGAILLILTFFIVFMNFISDILLAMLDPRIKLEGG